METTNNNNDELALYQSDDAGLGFEDFSTEELSVPIITVENGSRALDSGEIEGLKKGSIFDVTNQVVYNDGFRFVPLYFHHVHEAWIPRGQGSGKMGVFSDAFAKANREGEFPKFKLGDYDLVETWKIYAWNTSEHEVCVIPMTSTKIKNFRAWANMLRQFQQTLPSGKKVRRALCSHQTLMKSVRQTNRSFTSWNVEFSPLNGTLDNSLLDITSDLYRELVDYSRTIVEYAGKSINDPKTDFKLIGSKQALFLQQPRDEPEDIDIF